MKRDYSAILLVICAFAALAIGLYLEPPSETVAEFRAVAGMALMAILIVLLLTSTRKRVHHEQDLASAAEVLRREAARLDEVELLAGMGSWAWMVAADQFVWSAGMYRSHGHTPADMPVTYQALLAEVHPHDRERFDARVRRALTTGEPFDFHYRLLSPRGERILHARGKAVRDDTGQVVKLVGTCQDVTYTRRLENALLTRNKALQAANEREETVSRLKSEFISLASHELRTPLTIMQGSLQLLQLADGIGLSERARQDNVQRVLTQCLRLTRIVDDLLSVSQIERGTIPVRPQAVDLAKLLETALRDWLPIAETRRMTLVFPPQGQALPLVWADPDHVCQILTNLLDNAIKYSPDGQTVTVTVGEIPGFLQVIVTDHGIGIDTQDQPLIFERFHRIVTPAMYKERGTGLGLFISRQLTELQDGHMLMCSSLGDGSSFAFTLPLARHGQAPNGDRLPDQPVEVVDEGVAD